VKLPDDEKQDMRSKMITIMIAIEKESSTTQRFLVELESQREIDDKAIIEELRQMILRWSRDWLYPETKLLINYTAN